MLSHLLHKVNSHPSEIVVQLQCVQTKESKDLFGQINEKTTKSFAIAGKINFLTA